MFCDGIRHTLTNGLYIGAEMPRLQVLEFDSLNINTGIKPCQNNKLFSQVAELVDAHSWVW